MFKMVDDVCLFAQCLLMMFVRTMFVDVVDDKITGFIKFDLYTAKHMLLVGRNGFVDSSVFGCVSVSVCLSVSLCECVPYISSKLSLKCS